MRKWNERPREVANLLNPAFTGRLIYSAIKKYSNITKGDFSFPLVYFH